MISYYNGNYLEQSSIFISVDTPAFQYGLGVFTSLRTNNGKPILLAEHVKRVRENCRLLRIPFPEVDYGKIITNLIELNKNNNLRLKIIIFEEVNQQTGLIISAQELQVNNSPRKLTIISHNYQATRLRKIKSLNYMENLILHREALLAGFDDGILVNSQQLVCECCYANIFFVKKGEIYTPKANDNILNGIIRQQLMLEFPIIEKDILSRELETYEQVFITNSVQGITFVKEIAGYSYDTQAIPKLNEWSNNLLNCPY